MSRCSTSPVPAIDVVAAWSIDSLRRSLRDLVIVHRRFAKNRIPAESERPMALSQDAIVEDHLCEPHMHVSTEESHPAHSQFLDHGGAFDERPTRPQRVCGLLGIGPARSVGVCAFRALLALIGMVSAGCAAVAGSVQLVKGWQGPYDTTEGW